MPWPATLGAGKEARMIHIRSARSLASAILATLTLLAPVSCKHREHGLTIQGRPARGINLGNALEAPVEGEWGLVLQENHFALIAEAGFDLVRLPIRWTAHALEEQPYTIDPTFLARVDWAIGQALDRKLIAVINIHHFDDITLYPPAHKERFLALWRQLAEHYRDYDGRLWFEPLNEPNGPLDGERWNAYAAEAIAVIRESNPKRKLVVGPGNWNRFTQLFELELPDDPNLIVTFHYYEPFQFTHQGAEWVEGASLWMGTTWEGTEMEQRMLRGDLDMAVAVAERKGWQLFMGEFGPYSKADLDSRVRWTRFLVQEAEARGIAWAYWEFGAGFGIYDPQAGVWREDLLRALIPDSPVLRK
jgi:endoglucanase